MRLTLVVPELIWPEPADQATLGQLPLPGLEWLLAHARAERRPRRAFEDALGGCFGYRGAPLGALRRLGEPDAPVLGEEFWLCADPVHLRFHHERIVLADAGAFELDEEEAVALTATLNEQFAELGQFHVASARRWYLRLNAAPQGDFFQGAVDEKNEPISAVAGRRVDPEQSARTPTLSRWLNEIQMVLHGHPVNETRGREGKPAVNSLWLWGAGRLAPPAVPGHDAVWADGPLAAGLARAAGLPRHPLPAGLDALLGQAAPGANPLVVLDGLLAPVLYEDSAGWRQAAAALDAGWFVPLRAALGRRVKALEIVAPTIYGELHYTLGAGERWKFWRRPQPLAAIADRLASQLAGPAAEGKP